MRDWLLTIQAVPEPQGELLSASPPLPLQRTGSSQLHRVSASPQPPPPPASWEERRQLGGYKHTLTQTDTHTHPDATCPLEQLQLLLLSVLKRSASWLCVCVCVSAAAPLPPSWMLCSASLCSHWLRSVQGRPPPPCRPARRVYLGHLESICSDLVPLLSGPHTLNQHLPALPFSLCLPFSTLSIAPSVSLAHTSTVWFQQARHCGKASAAVARGEKWSTDELMQQFNQVSWKLLQTCFLLRAKHGAKATFFSFLL